MILIRYISNILILFFGLMTLGSCGGGNSPSREHAFENAPVTITAEVVINDSVIDHCEVQAIIDPLWYEVDFASEAAYLESLKRFTGNQKLVFAIQWYMAEVNNGGHSQFFTNSTGIVWEDALYGFKKAGLTDYYANLKKAVDLFPGKPSKETEEREAQHDRINNDFGEMDDAFYELDEKDPLEDRLLDFIRKNRNDFYFKGKVTRPFIH